jgi:hypothetical protein
MDLTVLYNSSGDLIAGVETVTFYIKRNLMPIYVAILEKTSFLSDDTSIKERIFYIKNSFVELQLCPYCKIDKLKYQSNKKCLSATCGSKNCTNKSKIRYRNTSHLYVNKVCSCGNIFKISKKSCLSRQYCSKHCSILYRKYSHSTDTISKIRESNKRTHNDPKWRLSKNEIYKQSHKKISDTMKKKILLGTFTPCITNSWTHWDASVVINNQIRKFRSFWEAAFYVLNLELNLEFEKIRIPYTHKQDVHSYIVDFVDTNNRILYEIKPDTTKNSEINQLKFNVASEWCIKNNYEFKIISDDYFKCNAHKINYDQYPQLYNSMKQFLNNDY